MQSINVSYLSMELATVGELKQWFLATNFICGAKIQVGANSHFR